MDGATLGDGGFRLAFALLIGASATAFLFAGALERAAGRGGRSIGAWVAGPLTIVGLCLGAGLFAPFARAPEGIAIPERQVFIGVPGFLGALYSLGLSVIALALLERVVRGAAEETRFALKFLALGCAGVLGSLVYVASKVLLYPPGFSLLPTPALHVVPIVFLAAVPLLFVAWRRTQAATGFAVSHQAAYASVSLLAVGAYLILSALGAKWAGAILGEDVPAEAIVFILLALGLGVALASTRIRGRLRHWVRRNLFSGRYDYRVAWLDATESIRATDPEPVLGRAVAALVRSGLRADRVSVWLGDGPGRLRLVAVTGGLPLELGAVASVGADGVQRVVEPFEVQDSRVGPIHGLPAGFLESTEAGLIAPLWSGGEFLGLVVVGPDRSGIPYDSDAKTFVGVLAHHAAGEIHKAKLLRAQLEASEARAFQAFSTFLLHDLKNFASTLSLIAQNAKRHGTDPTFLRDAFESVFQTSEKMKRLCNSLRAFSGGLAASKEPADPNEIVREVIGSLDAESQAKILLDLAPVRPIDSDPAGIQTVVRNLVMNALEAILEGGRITVTTRLSSGGVELAVADDGPGFPEEFLRNQLFVPFRTTKTHGLGIGLYQSKRIVEAHRGTIAVESEKGKGTTIRILLPIGEQSSEAP